MTDHPILAQMEAEDAHVRESMFLPILEILRAHEVPEAEAIAEELAAAVKVIGLSEIHCSSDYCHGVVDPEMLKRLGRRNWRGVSTPDLICELQYIQQEVEETTSPNHLLYLEYVAEAIEAELRRRRDMPLYDTGSFNRLVVEGIRAKADITRIVDYYTDVFVYQGRWTFRCPLHGEDKHPSGVIHRDEGTWHCFGCNRHGDIFDFIMAFEKVSFPKAVSLIGKLVGINAKANTRGGEGKREGGIRQASRAALREPYF